jgi:hypothetical protein
MRMFGIPTLFIPNMDTCMDDQVARCRVAEEEGWGVLHIDGDGDLQQKLASTLNLTPNPIVSENGVHSIKNLLGISQS